MPSFNPSDVPPHEPALDCSWRLEGVGAATVLASGTVNEATAGLLGLSIAEALVHARLVLIDFHDASFTGPAGERVIADAAARASHVGARLVVVGASAEIDSAPRGARTGTPAEVLDLASAGRRPGPSATDAVEAEARIRPFDNAVNASVLTARAMSVADHELWFQGDDGSVGRAWAPPTDGFPVTPGTPVDVYRDVHGDVNGWWERVSGLAVNQRLFDRAATPEADATAVCQGRCGIVWRAPAATRLAEHGEQCLTCAGHLVLR